jgi:nitroreductase
MTDRHPKHADPDYTILEPIAERWSPYAFDPTRTLEPAKLRSCLEAARWAASSYNEQPWSYLVARREDAAAFQTMLGCLLEANQAWAKNASLLMLTVVCRTFKLNGKPNRVAEHDIGLASGNLVIQAATLGVDVHQMAGINQSLVRQTYNIPEGYEAYTGIALGYAAPPNSIDDPKLRERETSPRTRKKLNEFVFAGTWGKPASL